MIINYNNLQLNKNKKLNKNLNKKLNIKLNIKLNNIIKSTKIINIIQNKNKNLNLNKKYLKLKLNKMTKIKLKTKKWKLIKKILKNYNIKFQNKHILLKKLQKNSNMLIYYLYISKKELEIKKKDKKNLIIKLIKEKKNKLNFSNYFEYMNINLNENNYNNLKLIKNNLDPFKYYVLSNYKDPIKYIHNNNYFIPFNHYFEISKWDNLFLNIKNFQFWFDILNSKYFLNYNKIFLSNLKLIFLFNIFFRSLNKNFFNFNNFKILFNLLLYMDKNINNKLISNKLKINKLNKKEKNKKIKEFITFFKLYYKFYSKYNKLIILTRKKIYILKNIIKSTQKKHIKNTKNLKFLNKKYKNLNILNKLYIKLKSKIFIYKYILYYYLYATVSSQRTNNKFWNIMFKNIFNLNNQSILLKKNIELISNGKNIITLASNKDRNEIINNKNNSKNNNNNEIIQKNQNEKSEEEILEIYYNNVLDFNNYLSKPVNLSMLNSDIYSIFLIMLINLRKNFIYSKKKILEKKIFIKIGSENLYKKNIKNIKDRHRLLFLNNNINLDILLQQYILFISNNEKIINVKNINSPIKFNNLDYKLIIYLLNIREKKLILNRFRKFSIFYFKFILSFLININDYYSNNKYNFILGSDYLKFNNIINISNFYNNYNFFNHYNFYNFKLKPYFIVSHRFFVRNKNKIEYKENYSKYKKVLYFILQEFKNLENKSDLWKLESQKIYQYTLKGNLISYDINNTFEQFATLDNFNFIYMFIQHFNSISYNYKFIIYSFFNNNSYFYNLNIDFILNCLRNFFFSMNFLISKPFFKIFNNKIICQFFFFANFISKFFLDIQYSDIFYNTFFYYVFYSKKFELLFSEEDKNKKFKSIIFKNFLKKNKYDHNIYNNNIFIINNFKFIFVIKILALLLGNLSKKPVELVLTRLYFPFNDANILAQFFVINSKIHNYSNMVRYLIFRANIYNHLSKKFFHFMVYEYNFNIKKASYISGINIRKAGRLVTQRVVPRVTLFTRFLGTFSRGKIVYFDFSRLTTKHKRGIVCITVSLSHFIFN